MTILVFGLQILVALNFASKVAEDIAIISEKPNFSVLYRENQPHEEATDTTIKSTPQSEALPEKRLSKTLFLVQFGMMISIFFLLWLSSTEDSYRSVFYHADRIHIELYCWNSYPFDNDHRVIFLV